MPEAAAGEQHRQVRVRVRVGAAHAGAVQHHRPVEQRVAFLLRSRSATLRKSRERVELRLLLRPQLGEHLRPVAVVRDVVDHGRVDEQGHDPRRVGLQGQLDDVVRAARSCGSGPRSGRSGNSPPSPAGTCSGRPPPPRPATATGTGVSVHESGLGHAASPDHWASGPETPRRACRGCPASAPSGGESPESRNLLCPLPTRRCGSWQLPQPRQRGLGLLPGLAHHQKIVGVTHRVRSPGDAITAAGGARRAASCIRCWRRSPRH